MGGVVSAVTNIVSDAADAVGGIVESAGDLVEDAVDVVKDAGSFIDDTIIQPALDDPIKTAVTIAAVAYGGPAAASALGTSGTVGAMVAAGTTTAATTLADGGDIEDALKRGVITASAVGAGATAGTAIAGETGSAAAGNIARGTVGNVTGAALSGGDIDEALKTGLVMGGINEGVNTAYSGIKNAIGEFGISAPTVDMPEIGDQPGDFPTTGGSFGTVTAPGVADATQALLDYNAAYVAPPTVEVPETPTPEAPAIGDQPGDFPTEGSFGTPTAPGVAEQTQALLDQNAMTAVGVNPAEGDQPGDFPTEGGMGSPTAPGVKEATDRLLEYNAQYYNPESELEKKGKNIVKSALANELLGDGLMASRTGVRPQVDIDVKPVDTGEDLTGTTNVALKQVGAEDYELRRFANDAGQSMTISFRGGKPLAPIPFGYRQVEVIGKAEGGLIEGQETLDRRKTNMVKYAGIAAPKKKNKKKIAGKGLASKKS